MTSTHKYHIISIQYPSRKCLPEKSCLDCLRILIMSSLFKDPAVIVKVIMSWLFKDPIVTVTWLNFNHAQSNSKKWLQGKKDQIAQNEFFSRKTVKFSCTYYIAPFILQNLKRILRADPELSGCVIFGHKMSQLSWTKFFDTNQYHYFHLLVGPFHCAKFTKNSYSRPKIVRMPIFGPKMAHLPETLFFLENY